MTYASNYLIDGYNNTAALNKFHNDGNIILLNQVVNLDIFILPTYFAASLH